MRDAGQMSRGLVRLGTYAVLAVVSLVVAGTLLAAVAGLLLGATLSVMAAGLFANWLAVRIYHDGRLPSVGFALTHAARNVGLGLLGGAGAALLVLGGPLAFGLASLEPMPDSPGSLASAGFVALALAFGAIGEELLFHGYGFQTLVRFLGPVAALVVSSVFFGLAHAGNLNASRLSVTNTVLWGIVLGYACLRARDLWLPIGVHYGWNLALPLFGVNLSGFTMGVTGRTLRWRVGELWSGGEYGPEGGLLTLLVLPLLLLYLRLAPVRPQALPLLTDGAERTV